MAPKKEPILSPVEVYTLKGNNKMAQFLGYELEETLKKEFVYAIRHNGRTEFYYPKELLYRSSWNWLMPVVRKLLYEFTGEEFSSFTLALKKALLTADIHIVWHECFDFITAINKTKIPNYEH